MTTVVRSGKQLILEVAAPEKKFVGENSRILAGKIAGVPVIGADTEISSPQSSRESANDHNHGTNF